MNSFFRAIRIHTRSLLRQPRYTVAALVSSAIGLGTITCLYAVLSATLLRPLPYEDSERLVLLWTDSAVDGIKNWPVSYPNFLDWREQNTVFATMAAFAPVNGTLLA